MAPGRGGFARTKWCGEPRVRAGHEGKGRRFLPLHAAARSPAQRASASFCGKEATTDIYWGVAY